MYRGSFLFSTCQHLKLLTYDPFQISATLRLYEQSMSNSLMKTTTIVFSSFILLHTFKPSVHFIGGRSHESQMKNSSQMNGVSVLSQIYYIWQKNSVLQFWQWSEFVLLVMLLHLFLSHILIALKWCNANYLKCGITNKDAALLGYIIKSSEGLIRLGSSANRILNLVFPHNYWSKLY